MEPAPVDTTADWPVLGREVELDQAMRSLRDGRGVLVTGEAGTGRSALAAEVVARWSRRLGTTDVPPLVVRVPAGSAAVPLAALSAHPTATDADADADVADWQRVADRLAPAGRPRVVLVDDVHWLDDASAGLLHQLVHAGRILLVATARRGVPAPTAINQLWKDRVLTRIDLAPLGTDDVTTLLERVLGAPVEPRTAEQLHRRTAGRPQLLRELVESAVDGGALRLRHGAWVGHGDVAPGPRLVDLLVERLDDLDDTARRAAQIVLVAAPVRVGLLGTLVAPADLDRLVALGWCSIDRDDDPVVRISVPLMAEVLDATMGPLQRTAIRRELVGRLDTGTLTDDERLRATTWRIEAGMELDADDALRAADHAIATSRFRDAQRIAEALASDGAAGSVGARASLRLGEALLADGRHVGCDAVLDAIRDRIDDFDDEERSRFTTARAKAWHSDLGRLDDAVVLLRAEIEALPPGRLRWGLEAYLAFMLADCGRLNDARPLAAAGIARVEEDPPSALRAMIGAGVVQTLGGRSQDTLDLCERMLPVAFEHLEAVPEGVGWVVAAQMLAQYVRGDLVEAEAFGNLVEMFVADSPDPTLQAAVLLYRGTIAGDRGDLDGALAMLRKSAALHEVDNRRGYQAWSFASTARVLAQRGDVDGAADAAAAAHAQRWPSGQNFDAEIAIADLWVAALRGDTDGAERHLASVLEASEREGAVMLSARARHEAIRAGLDPEPHVDELVRLAEADQGRWTAAQSKHATGLATVDGDLLLDAGDGFATLGIAIQAAEAYGQAAAAFHRAGSVTSANRAQALKRTQLASTTGAATPALRAGSPDTGLTPRELAAVRRAISGESNAEIAQALGVGVRTVETHLQRAYAKLGVRSRRELAAALDRT